MIQPLPFLRTFLLVAIFTVVAPTVAQNGVDLLKNSSDAGQAVFDKRVKEPTVHTGRIYERKAVDEAAVYPGGEKALESHLLEPALCGVLPPMEKCFGSSKMTFDFVVNVDGSVTDVAFTKEGCAILRSHVLCAVRGLSVWKPAEVGGVPVRVRLRASVRYDLR